MGEKKLKKLTILHSNDMHGDFQAEQVDDKLIGGVSFLSGYIQKVREEEENVLYVVSGDMFRASALFGEMCPFPHYQCQPVSYHQSDPAV